MEHLLEQCTTTIPCYICMDVYLLSVYHRVTSYTCKIDKLDWFKMYQWISCSSYTFYTNMISNYCIWIFWLKNLALWMFSIFKFSIKDSWFWDCRYGKMEFQHMIINDWFYLVNIYFFYLRLWSTRTGWVLEKITG